jgi:hypothetical protein
MKCKFLYISFFFAFCLVQSSCDKIDLWNLEKLPEFNDPQIKTNSLTSFSIEAILKTDGFDKITLSGFCWSDVNQDPTIMDNRTDVELDGNKMNIQLDWSGNSKLFVRAFAKNNIGYAYSKTIVVNWLGNSSNLPVIQTLQPTEVGFFEMNVTGQILSDGGLPILEKGFCYSSVNQLPTLNDSHFMSQSSNFSELLNSIQENTTYFIRSYAKNLQGISFGNVIQVSTKNFYYVGETGPANGLIFYSKTDDSGGWHFLEAAPQDIGLTYNWGVITQTNVTATAIGTGSQNTITITNILGPGNYAALQSSNFSFGGFSDWYLPSRDELVKIRENLMLNPNANLLLNEAYWSSSEDTNFSNNAWYVQMISGNGGIATAFKSTVFNVRPIRQF